MRLVNSLVSSRLRAQHHELPYTRLWPAAISCAQSTVAMELQLPQKQHQARHDDKMRGDEVERDALHGNESEG